MLLTYQKENSAEMSLLSTGLTFIPTWNNIEKEKLKLELGAFGGKLQWKWHFRNGEKDFDYDNFKTKFTINPRNTDVATDLCLRSLQEKLTK